VPDFAFMAGLASHIIDLSRLELGTHRFDIQLDNAFFASVEKSEIQGGEVAATAVLSLREEDYSLAMKVKGTVQVVCDRCLDAMNVEIDDEQDIEQEEGQMIDLAWLAYELVCINLPLVCCHPAGACNPQMDALLQQHLCSTDEEPEDIEIE
jgi:uncharacterized metal-binding protein YceD (DUF177 family)